MTISLQPSASASERNDIRFCPKCLTPMALVCMASDTPGFELRTFDCPACARNDRGASSVDAVRSGANGWLSSRLYPPS